MLLEIDKNGTLTLLTQTGDKIVIARSLYTMSCTINDKGAIYQRFTIKNHEDYGDFDIVIIGNGHVEYEF